MSTATVDFAKLRDWNPAFESDQDKMMLHTIPQGDKIVRVLCGQVGARHLRGVVNAEDAGNKSKLAGYLVSYGYAVEALKTIYHLTQPEIDANRQLVKGTTAR